MDVLDLLIADHNRVRGLFTRCRDAHEKNDMATMQELAGEIFTELEVHTTIEEEIFYPWATGLSDEIRETIDEGIEEHHVAKTVMQEAAKVPAGSDQWVAKITVLIESVEHHAGEEEEELFPSIRSHSSAATRKEVGAQVEDRKVQLGADTMADKEGLSLEELRQLATEQQIPGRSSMGRDELAATVKTF